MTPIQSFLCKYAEKLGALWSFYRKAILFVFPIDRKVTFFPVLIVSPEGVVNFVFLSAKCSISVGIRVPYLFRSFVSKDFKFIFLSPFSWGDLKLSSQIEKYSRQVCSSQQNSLGKEKNCGLCKRSQALKIPSSLAL